MAFNHIPVMAEEVLAHLNVRPDGMYLDGTLGGGGHAAMVYERLGSGGVLIGIDRDTEALAAAEAHIRRTVPEGRARLALIHGNFHDARALLEQAGFASSPSGVSLNGVLSDGARLSCAPLGGALLDLGVSSYQLDARERGFSYHADAALDMRMDASQPLTARDIVNTYPAADIARILRDFGEENWAAQIARVIVDRRETAPIETTVQLVDIIDAAIPKKLRAKDGSHPARRSFQALRIAVNDELLPLADALRDIVSLLATGGRLCVIAFHSLEDRIVKTAFRELANPCVCPPGFPVCVCGRQPQVRLITGKPIKPSPQELEVNPRARSATLRVVEKL